MPAIQIRPVRDEDISDIKAWPPYPPEFSGLDYSLRDGGWLDEYRSKPGAEILIAVDGTQIIGFSILSLDGDGILELRIALHPERIGGGFGKKIMLLTIRRGFSFHNAERIRLIVRKNNLRAQALYTSLHFSRRGECTERIQGEPIDFFNMEIARAEFVQENDRIF